MSELDEIKFKQEAQEAILNDLLSHKNQTMSDDNKNLNPDADQDTATTPEAPATGNAPAAPTAAEKEPKPVRFKVAGVSYEFTVKAVFIRGVKTPVEKISAEDRKKFVESGSIIFKPVNN